MTLSRCISEPQLSDPVRPPSTHHCCHRASIFRNSSLSFLSPFCFYFPSTCFTFSITLPSLLLFSSLFICLYHSASLSTLGLKQYRCWTDILCGECRAAPWYAILRLVGLLIFCTGEQVWGAVCKVSQTENKRILRVTFLNIYNNICQLRDILNI